jgi:glutathione peroxidase
MITRRSVLSLLAAASAAPAAAAGAHAQANMSRASAHAFAFAGLDGRELRLAAHAGKPILIVNTASLCGYTPQYAGLQELWQRYRGRGLMVIGVPSNDFGGQEPGGKTEIDHTVHRYGVTFPLAAKVDVRGAGAHPFYRWLALERPGDVPRWNFHKYLIDRDGRLKASFPSAVTPTDPRIVAAIERELPPG